MCLIFDVNYFFKIFYSIRIMFIVVRTLSYQYAVNDNTQWQHKPLTKTKLSSSKKKKKIWSGIFQVPSWFPVSKPYFNSSRLWTVEILLFIIVSFLTVLQWFACNYQSFVLFCFVMLKIQQYTVGSNVYSITSLLLNYRLE